MRSRHDIWNIEQMIEMPVSDQNRIGLGREMSHPLCNARHVRLKTRTKRNTQKVNTRKIGIDQQSVAIELKLVTISAKVSHPHSVARRCRRIPADQISIRIEPRA